MVYTRGGGSLFQSNLVHFSQKSCFAQFDQAIDETSCLSQVLWFWFKLCHVSLITFCASLF